MQIKHALRLMLVAVALLGGWSVASAQEVVRKEAPPEIRALFQALTAAANADAAAWERFAKAHYTAEAFNKQTPAQRAETHKKIQDTFGTIAINGVRREMDGPLHVMVKGSKAEGTIDVDLDFGTSKIFTISVQ